MSLYSVYNTYIGKQNIKHIWKTNSRNIFILSNFVLRFKTTEAPSPEHHHHIYTTPSLLSYHKVSLNIFQISVFRPNNIFFRLPKKPPNIHRWNIKCIHKQVFEYIFFHTYRLLCCVLNIRITTFQIRCVEAHQSIF